MMRRETAGQGAYERASLEALIAAGVQTCQRFGSTKPVRGMTPLHWAAYTWMFLKKRSKKRAIEVAQEIAAGAEPGSATIRMICLTPLHTAVSFGRPEAIALC